MEPGTRGGRIEMISSKESELRDVTIDEVKPWMGG